MAPPGRPPAPTERSAGHPRAGVPDPAVRLARGLDRLLHPPLLGSLLGWGLASQLFLAVAVFVVDLGTGGSVVDRWWPGVEVGLGGEVSWATAGLLPTLVAGSLLGGLVGFLSGRSIRHAGGEWPDRLVLVGIVVLPWLLRLGRLGLIDPGLALRMAAPVFTWGWAALRAAPGGRS